MAFTRPVHDENAIIVPQDDALLPDIKDGLKRKMVTAIDMALDVTIKAMSGQVRIKPIQLQAAKMVMGYAPRPEHGAAPITLVLPGIPRPQRAIDVKVTPVPGSTPDDPLG